MANKKKWTKKELQDFQKVIIGKREKAISDLDIAKERAEDMKSNNTQNAIYSSHMADAGSDHSEMEKSYYMIARENKFVEYLNRALDMIEEGTFGVCKACGELIAKERLLEVPHTTSCFSCKTKVR
jgi:RNA polymerase-binding transcription factor DksA